MWAEKASPQAIMARRLAAPDGTRRADRNTLSATIAGAMSRQCSAACVTDSLLTHPGADRDEYPADDFGRSFARIPQIGEFGPRQHAAGAVVRIVDCDLVTVESEQDAVVAQAGLPIEPMVQDHTGITREQLSKQLGRLFRLESHGRKALSARVEGESMRTGGLDSGTDFFGQPLPNSELTARQPHRAIDHGQGSRAARPVAVNGLLRFERNRRHVA